MSQKLSFLLLGVVLVLRCLQAEARPQVSQSDIETDSRNWLLIFVLDGFVNLANFTVTHAEVLLEKTTRELSAIRGKSDRVKECIAKFQQYLATVKEVKAMSPGISQKIQLTQLMEKFDGFVETIYAPSSGDLATDLENVIIKREFEKNGMKEIDEGYWKRFIEFLPRFQKVFDEFVSKMSAQARVNDAKLLKWYDEFKMDDDKAKAKKFVEFFTLY